MPSPYIRVVLADSDNNCEIVLVTDDGEYDIPTKSIVIGKKAGCRLDCNADLVISSITSDIPFNLFFNKEILSELENAWKDILV